VVLPVHDVNPTRRTPWVTRILLLVNLAVFVLSPMAVAPLLGSSNAASICSQVAYLDEFAVKPAEVIAVPQTTAGKRAQPSLEPDRIPTWRWSRRA